jgi:hypothetical protein
VEPDLGAVPDDDRSVSSSLGIATHTHTRLTITLYWHRQGCVNAHHEERQGGGSKQWNVERRNLSNLNRVLHRRTEKREKTRVKGDTEKQRENERRC